MSLFARQPSVIQYYGTQIQSAVQALPIPIVYGAPRLPGNIIYVNGFNAVKQQTGGKGGKGLLSGGKGSNQFLYYATLIVALCEGPIANIVVIYQDSNVWFNLSGIREVDPSSQTGKSGQPNFIPTDAQFFPGGDQQLPWDYIESRWPADARSYKDTCYIGLPNMQLDSTALPPQLNWVPYGRFVGTCPLNPATFTGQFTDNSGQHAESFFAGYVDADPATCIFDFLTNSRYGAGFPSTLIDPGMFSSNDAFNPAVGDAALQTYCQAVGFGFSVAVNNAEAASSVLDRWTKNMAVAVVWTGEILKFLPYWDQFSGSNPGWGTDNPNGIQLKYFQPNNEPLLALADEIFLQAQNPQEEPVTMDRVDPIDVYNYVRVSFSDRTNQFNDNIAQDSDEVSIELYGPRVDSSQTANEYSFPGYAQASATVQLRRNLSIRRRVTFRLPPTWGFLDPMDIITITSGILNNFPVRVVSLEEDEAGAITVVAEEFPAGAGSPTIFPSSPTSAPTILQTNAPVSSVNPPVIIEPTAELLAAQGLTTATVIIGASGSNGVVDPNWGGCAVYSSLDNVTYQLLGNFNGPSRQGVLTANLASYGGANPDNTNVLSVSLAESGGTLSSTTESIASQGATLCAIVNPDGTVEFLTYTTAILTSLYSYQLTGLFRGLYGTTASGHLSGAQFLRLDQVIFERPLPPQFIGQTIYFKLPSFNIYNQQEQDLSDPTVVVYTYTPNGGGTRLFISGTSLAGGSGAGGPI